jgi:hypothetical protein
MYLIVVNPSGAWAIFISEVVYYYSSSAAKLEFYAVDFFYLMTNDIPAIDFETELLFLPIM